MNCSHGNKELEIELGGTARNPGDVEILHKFGLKFAEIPIYNFIQFKKNINKYLREKEKTGLYFLCHGPREGDPNDIGSLERDYLPYVSKILEIMPILNMSLLTLHLWIDRRFVKTMVVDFKIDLLGKIINKAKEKKIFICLENLSEDVHDLRVAFDALPLLNLTLDVGHAQLLRKENTCFTIIKQYPNRIKHIHLHDNYGGFTPEDDLHLPPGRGIVDFQNIFNSLRIIGYKGTATLELEPFEIKPCLRFVKQLFRV